MFCTVVCCAQSSGCRSLSVMLQKTNDDKLSVMLSHQSKRNSQHLELLNIKKKQANVNKKHNRIARCIQNAE